MNYNYRKKNLKKIRSSIFFYNVEAHKTRVMVYAQSLKSMFYRQIDKAHNFEIWLVAESKMNEIKITENER